MLDFVTAFDAIAVAVIVISAIMAFARGFLREIATMGAFIGALTAAFYARKFLRDDLRQQRCHSLPHFELRHGHGNDAVLTDLEPRIEQMFAARGDERVGIAARHQRPGEQQSAAHRRTRNHSAARNLHWPIAPPR